MIQPGDAAEDGGVPRRELYAGQRATPQHSFNIKAIGDGMAAFTSDDHASTPIRLRAKENCMITAEPVSIEIKRAQPDYPIHPLLQGRFSPRAFAPRPVEAEKLRSLLEAARWSASGAWPACLKATPNGPGRRRCSC